MTDDHPCCTPAIGSAIARLREMADIAELARKDAERLRSLQCSGIIDREDDLMPRVYVEFIKRCWAVEIPREKPWDCCPAEVEATLKNWPTQLQSALASESKCVAAGTADEKPDGQAENADVDASPPLTPQDHAKR